MKIHFSHKKSCFQLEDALTSGSRWSSNLGWHCQILLYVRMCPISTVFKELKV